MGMFKSKQEGRDACFKLADDPNSPYYQWRISGRGHADGRWHF